MVAFLPFLTTGVRKRCWFSNRLSILVLSDMYLIKANPSWSLVLGSSISSRHPTACMTLVSSPLLMSFSFRSMNWNLIPRSLKYRCAFLVSKHFLVPNICMFMLFLRISRLCLCFWQLLIFFLFSSEECIFYSGQNRSC